MKKSHSESYQVGYGRPPKARQFRKGQTGNPKGRRRGDENLTSVFKRYVSQLVRVSEGDKPIKITLAEAVILKNYNAALQKNAFAISNIFKLAEESGELVDQTDAKQAGGMIAVPIRSKNISEFLAEFGRTPETE